MSTVVQKVTVFNLTPRTPPPPPRPPRGERRSCRCAGNRTSCPRSESPSFLCRFRILPSLLARSPLPSSVAWLCSLSSPRLYGSSSSTWSALFCPCCALSSSPSYLVSVRVIGVSFEGSWTDPYSSSCGPWSDSGCASSLWSESASCDCCGECGSCSRATASVMVCVWSGSFSCVFSSVSGIVAIASTDWRSAAWARLVRWLQRWWTGLLSPSSSHFPALWQQPEASSPEV